MKALRLWLTWGIIPFFGAGIATGFGKEPASGGKPKPAFTEEVLVDYGQADDEVAVNGKVVRSVVKDPAGSGRTVLRVVYPAYVKGETEWPALKIAGKALAKRNWSGRDAVLLRVFNPTDDVVNIGFFVRAGKKRFGPHADLQPSVWNTLVWPLADLARAISLEDIAEVHVFMTRPRRKTTIYLSTLSLVRERNRADDPFVSPFALAEFEIEAELSRWQANAVKVSLDRAWHTQGSSSVRVVYPKYVPGQPRWPAFQARYYNGALPLRDWRGFDTLALEVKNAAPAEAPLSLYLRDQDGKEARKHIPVPAKGIRQVEIALDSLGIDLSRVVQIDFYMSTPEREFPLAFDHLRLVGNPLQPVDETLARFRTSIEAAAGLQPYLSTKHLQAMKQTRMVVEALREGAKTGLTFGSVQMLNGGLRAAEKQMAQYSRDVQIARLAAATAARVPKACFAVGTADSMTKVPIRDQPLAGVTANLPVHLEMARREWESFQVVVTGAQKPLQRVRVEPGSFQEGKSGYRLPDGAVTACVVGHVKTRKPPYPVPYVGWWPDPILDFQRQCVVSEGEAVSFWVRIHTPATAKAGTYAGRVTVRAEAAPPVEIPVTLRIFDFTLPKMSFLPTACSFYDSIKKMWDPDMSEAEYERRLTECADFLASYKIDLDHIYRRPTPNPADLRLPLRQWKMLRDQGRLRAFMIFHVATPRNVTDPKDPAVDKTIDRCLRGLEYWVPRLRREGLLRYAYLYGYDEVPAANFPVMAKVFGSIKKAYPDIPLMTTAYDHSYGMDTGLVGKVDRWVPLTPRFIPEKVAEARARGMDVWWYICIGPKHPYCNWLIEYPAIEARLLMGAMTAKYRPGGFLYYALTRWPVNKAPITSGPYTDWDPRSYKTNNGDGSLFCAGPEGLLATIRAENFRDGMEDNDYVVLLRRLIQQAEARPRRGWALRRALAKARKAEVVPTDLVGDLKTYSRNPEVLRAWRHRVGVAIETLSDKLE